MNKDKLFYIYLTFILIFMLLTGLGLAFIIVKLCNLISWSWLVVLIPMFIDCFVISVIIAIYPKLY